MVWTAEKFFADRWVTTCSLSDVGSDAFCSGALPFFPTEKCVLAE